MTTITRPVPFPGTEAQWRKNLRTHQFGGIDGRCWECDVKPWHESAKYPCGTRVPRETVEVSNG